MLTVNEQVVILKRYGFDDNDPLADWLNASMRDIEMYEDWPWLEVLTNLSGAAFSNTFSLPADAFKIIDIRDTVSFRKLEPMSRTQFDREIQDPTAQGAPRVYITTGMTTIQLYPVPDFAGTYQVTYQKTITDVVVPSASSPPIPEPFHYPMCLNAAYIALMAENEEERAQTAQKQFEAAMLKLMDRYGARNLDDPESVTDYMEYGAAW